MQYWLTNGKKTAHFQGAALPWVMYKSNCYSSLFRNPVGMIFCNVRNTDTPLSVRLIRSCCLEMIVLRITFTGLVKEKHASIPVWKYFGFNINISVQPADVFVCSSNKCHQVLQQESMEEGCLFPVYSLFYSLFYMGHKYLSPARLI